MQTCLNPLFIIYFQYELDYLFFLTEVTELVGGMTKLSIQVITL